MLKDDALKAAMDLAASDEKEMPVSNPEPEQSKQEQEVPKEEPKTEAPKEEPKPEEKPIEPAEQKQEQAPTEYEIDGQKFQVEDLRKAIDDSKNKENWTSKLTQESQELSKLKSVVDKMKDVFTEKEDKGQELTPEEEHFRQEADTLFNDPYVKEKIAAEAKRLMEEERQAIGKQEAIKKLTEEVKKLEQDFDGKDGRPKYIDSDVLKWQKENNKLTLMPKEAYELMNKDALIEWEVQKRLKNKGGEAPKQTSSAPTKSNPVGEEKKLSHDRFERRSEMQELLTSMNAGE